MNTKSLILLLGILLPVYTRPQTPDLAMQAAIHTDFEGGSLGRVERLAPLHFRCAVQGESDQDHRNRQANWYFFRLDGAAGRQVTIDLADLDGEYNYRPGLPSVTNDTYPVYSYDRKTWKHFETIEWDDKTIQLRLRFTPAASPMWIAHVPPYTTQDLARLLDAFRGHPSLRRETVGKTVAGRDMLLLTVTNFDRPEGGKPERGRSEAGKAARPEGGNPGSARPESGKSETAKPGAADKADTVRLGTPKPGAAQPDSPRPNAAKRVAWLMIRQHSWETGSSWAGEGALRFLLSSDPRATRIRDQVIFKIFPMADPDGVARGGVRFNANGFDLNRNWDAVDPKRTPEIAAQRQAVLGWVDSGRPVDLFLSLHNTETSEYVDGAPAGAEPRFQSLVERFFRLLVETTTFSPTRPPSDPGASTTPGQPGRMNVAQGLYHDRKVPALIMEQMIARNPKLGRLPTVADRIEFGAALARAMAAAVTGASARGE